MNSEKQLDAIVLDFTKKKENIINDLYDFFEPDEKTNIKLFVDDKDTILKVITSKDKLAIRIDEDIIHLVQDNNGFIHKYSKGKFKKNINSFTILHDNRFSH